VRAWIVHSPGLTAEGAAAGLCLFPAPSTAPQTRHSAGSLSGGVTSSDEEEVDEEVEAEEEEVEEEEEEEEDDDDDEESIEGGTGACGAFAMAYMSV